MRQSSKELRDKYRFSEKGIKKREEYNKKNKFAILIFLQLCYLSSSEGIRIRQSEIRLKKEEWPLAIYFYQYLYQVSDKKQTKKYLNRYRNSENGKKTLAEKARRIRAELRHSYILTILRREGWKGEIHKDIVDSRRNLLKIRKKLKTK